MHVLDAWLRALLNITNYEQHDMKADIHPKYTDVNVKCSCGNAFTTRSTYGKEDMTIDVCSECHPFYTGKQKILDSAGQIDKFNKRFGNK
jgi:large subunit ribosomal protein L31